MYNRAVLYKFNSLDHLLELGGDLRTPHGGGASGHQHGTGSAHPGGSSDHDGQGLPTIGGCRERERPSMLLKQPTGMISGEGVRWRPETKELGRRKDGPYRNFSFG